MTLFRPEHSLPNNPGPEDVAFAITETIAGIVPGGAALLKFIVAPPAERRLNEWMEEVGDELRTLSERAELDILALQQDEQFIDAVTATTQAALRTSQEGKRRALLNALLNAAMPMRPDATFQQIFIGLVDRFTDVHLRLLLLFQDPRGFIDRHNVPYRTVYTGAGAHLIEAAFPELTSQRPLYDLVWSELQAAGLTTGSSLHSMTTADGVMAKRTSDLGDSFLKFIAQP